MHRSTWYRAVTFTIVIGLAGAGCGTPPTPAAPSNTPSEPAPRDEVALDPGTPLGAMALPAAVEPPEGAPYWVARTGDAAAVVPTPVRGLDAGTTYAAIAASGEIVELTAGAVTTIAFGCDGTTLEVVPLTGAAVPPALVWVLPSPVPETWKPAAVPLVLELDTREARRWTAGPLVLELARVDRTHARFRITHGGAVVHDERAEAYMMEGADPIDLDMTGGRRPGIPAPEAVFAVGEGGPYLVVIDQSGYESASFATLLVRATGRVRAIDPLELGAYYCAF